MDKQFLTDYLNSMEEMRKVFFYSKFHIDIPRGELSTLEAIKTLLDDGMKATTSALSDLLSISKPAVSQAINTLEKKGWVRRDIDKNDKRVYCLSLTPEGEEKIMEIKQKSTSTVTQILTELGENDAMEFLRLSNKLKNIIKNMIEKDQFMQ